MRYFLVLAFLPLLSANVIAQSYPFHQTEEGHIILSATLNDSIVGTFVLDTGAGITVISGRLFERLQGQAKASGFYTGFRHDGDRLDGKLYRIPTLIIGGLSQKDVEVGVYPPLDALGIDGLLSLNLFREHPITIDYTKNEISFPSTEELSQHATTQQQLPIHIIQHGETSLDILLNYCLNDSISVRALFDTGSGHHAYFIQPHFMKALGFNQENTEIQPYTKLISQTTGKDYHAILPKLSLCDSNQEKQVQKDIPVRFREDLIYEALIGSSVFAKSSIIIDLANKRILMN